MKQPSMNTVTSLSTHQVSRFSLGLTLCYFAFVSIAVAAPTANCTKATAALKNVETRYAAAAQDLNRASITCKGDYNCIHGFQQTYDKAKADLVTAQDSQAKACS